MPVDLVTQALSAASEEIFNRCGKDEIAPDDFHCAALTSEIVSEGACDVSSCDVS